MQDYLNSKLNDEIDFSELCITLWAYKLLIVSAFVLGVIFGIYKIQNTDKLFTSVAIFKLNSIGSSNLSASQDLNILANIAGFGAKGSSSSFPIDQIKGRIFIEKIDTRLNFQADPYFYTYDPKLVEPAWKSLIKRAIGWQKSSSDAYEVMWQRISNTYTNNVALDKTPDNSFTITVTHVDPKRAAKIANVIMETVISLVENKIKKQQDQQLLYLSTTLAKALNDLEISESNLKAFALENSALPIESFTAESMQLDALREQLKRTTELQEAVAALSLILQNNTINHSDYLALRQQYPIVDRVEFRRVLGQNEIISSWNWPEASSVEKVLDTLSERKNRLLSQIKVSQINAERSGQALETYAKLERKSNIAKASYTVLIEQVKSQSMIAGFSPNNVEIYEYASAPIKPSSPNRKLTLALGGILGLFIGILLSLVLALNRGVYYSRNSLKTGAQTRFTFNVKTLLRLRNKSLNEINTIVTNKPQPILRDLAVEIHKSCAAQVVVTSSRSKLSSYDAARALASYIQSHTMKVAVINFSSRAKKPDIDLNRLSIGSFVITESIGHVSVLRPDGDLAAIELLGQRDFLQNIQSINSNFDLVFLSADDGDAISLLSALEGQKTFHVTLARIKKTKSASLTQMSSYLPIQGLLYD